MCILLFVGVLFLQVMFIIYTPWKQYVHDTDIESEMYVSLVRVIYNEKTRLNNPTGLDRTFLLLWRSFETFPRQIIALIIIVRGWKVSEESCKEGVEKSLSANT